jgi:hypothetical protein
LVKISQDLGMKEVEEYKVKLGRVDKGEIDQTESVKMGNVTNLPQSINLKILQTVKSNVCI